MNICNYNFYIFYDKDFIVDIYKIYYSDESDAESDEDSGV